jgi:hypothetical protein
LTVSDTEVGWLKPPKLAVTVMGPNVPTAAFAMLKVAWALPFAGTETELGIVHMAPVGQPELTPRLTLPENPFTDETVTV